MTRSWRVAVAAVALAASGALGANVLGVWGAASAGGMRPAVMSNSWSAGSVAVAHR